MTAKIVFGLQLVLFLLLLFCSQTTDPARQLAITPLVKFTLNINIFDTASSLAGLQFLNFVVSCQIPIKQPNRKQLQETSSLSQSEMEEAATG